MMQLDRSPEQNRLKQEELEFQKRRAWTSGGKELVEVRKQRGQSALEPTRHVLAKNAEDLAKLARSR